MSYIEIRNIFKIFGPDPQTALQMAKAGADKDEILAKTGHTVGLHDVSLSIERGETFVVMGLSGSGKSTLIRHLNRLIDPTSGEVLFDGTDILAMSISELNAFRRKRLGMVFQRFGLLPHRNVINNVAYGLEIQGQDRKTREDAARNWIERVGLGGYEDKFPDQLSGGMQQRVGLARALATDPEVLLMDEAFSALDPLIRNDMQDELVKLQGELHKTIVFITHDLDEALKLGDRIAILKDGKLIQTGRPEEIIMHPADNYVRAFTRDVNRSRVLRARTLMQPISDDDNINASWPRIADDMRLEDILPVALATNGSMSVIDGQEKLIGILSKEQVIAALVA
ncbi:quaternary amine ABC transporter ATP-binding protein [Thalassospira alkalitolerans]|uniref:Quaternary amine transport ATP-binding protein n=1 Tax=Thalassospira alkalitolerans TaxID=1293890 RepID=A0A1Y2LCW4_9PROT|nr:glycine betaine/L-proline ABC transporter ATP-binding protein [Thalassospira alkalitolerans]OSQ48483.1 glycine/betaine ABC transporter [Thalassospira alkalitolerans]